jgi:hypothetical protein
MRTALLIPLAFATTVLAGCGSEVSDTSRQETAARTPAAPERDLTLSVPRITETEVASPVELARVKPVAARPRASRLRVPPTPVPPPASAVEPEPEPAAPAGDPVADPVIVPAVSTALAEAIPVDDAASGGRELAPGKTVTIIPVSTGPSVEADEGDAWLPSEPSRGVLVGGGGTCRRRGGGGGIGIAARIRVSGPAFPLR